MSLEAFLSQGGFAFFVWGAYGMAVLLLGVEILVIRQRRRTIVARLKRLQRLRTQEVGHEGTS